MGGDSPTIAPPIVPPASGPPLRSLPHSVKKKSLFFLRSSPASLKKKKKAFFLLRSTPGRACSPVGGGRTKWGGRRPVGLWGGYGGAIAPHFVRPRKKKSLFFTSLGGGLPPPRRATLPIGSGFAGGASAPRCLLVPHFVPPIAPPPTVPPLASCFLLGLVFCLALFFASPPPAKRGGPSAPPISFFLAKRGGDSPPTLVPLGLRPYPILFYLLGG